MRLFDYTGQLQSGATFQGTLEADSQDRAERVLAEMGIRVLSLRPAQRFAYVAPLSLDDFLFFNEQVAAMAKAGVPLQDGLRQLAADVGTRKLKRLLLDVADDLASGTPIEQAVTRQRQRFPTQYAEVVRAGLRTGDLGGALYGLTAHLRLKSNVRRALIELAAYPLIILIFAFCILSGIMRIIVPAVQATIADTVRLDDWQLYQTAWGATTLPPSARVGQAMAEVTFSAADVWPMIELALAALLLGVFLLILFTFLPQGRGVREWLLRRIPGIAQIYGSSVLARFAHTSALAAYSGTPLPDMIAAGGAASGSMALAKASRRVADRLAGGDSLEQAAGNEPEIPALWTCLVSATAPRGDLPTALAELARSYELRAQQWISTMRIILGPLLLLVVGALLGGVVVGVIGALVTVIQRLGV